MPPVTNIVNPKSQLARPVTNAKADELVLVTSDLYAEQKKFYNPEIDIIQQEFERAKWYWDKDFDRSMINWKMYWGVDAERGMGQYPEKIVQRLIREGRHLAQYNIITPKVDNLAGAMHKNPFETKFLPLEGDVTDDTLAYQEAYHSDREMLDWESTDFYQTIHGLIFNGTKQIKISDRYHPLGNIDWELCLPNHVIFDPHWKEISLKKCKKCWHISYMTPREMQEIFKAKADLIDYHVAMQRRYGTQLGENYGITPYLKHEEIQWGDKWQVIAYHYMVEKTITRERIMTPAGDYYLPESDDKQFKIAWLDKNFPDWRNEPRNVVHDEEKRNICYRKVVAPHFSRSIILDDGMIEEQCNQLPFSTWSAYRLQGECRGVVDLLKDAQRTINYREGLLTYIIQTNAMGSKVIDPSLFNGDMRRTQDLINNANNPGYWAKCAPGKLRLGLTKYIGKINEGGTYDAGVTNQLQRMYEISDRISPAAGATEGRTDSHKESGVLYAQRVKQQEQTQYVLFQGKRQAKNDEAEMALELMPQVYGNEDVRREFIRLDGRRTVLNEKTGGGKDNTPVVRHQIREMPRHKVVLTEAPYGDTNKMVTRQLANDALKSIPPEDAITRQILASQFVGTFENFDQATKNELEQGKGLEKQLAIETVKTNILKNKMEQQALMNPQPALPPGQTMPQKPTGGQPPAQ